jgi:hypothetical protein
MDVSSAMGGYSDWRACSYNPIEQIASYFTYLFQWWSREPTSSTM